jgi:hypothetical protein
MSDAPGRPPVSSLADAVADMRTTARWTIAAAGAVAALLLGGAPLTAAGKITHAGDAVLALAGLLVALGGVGWAVWWTGEALMPRIATIANLSDPDLSDLRGAMARDATAFYGPFGHSGDDVRAAIAFHSTVAANLAVTAAAEPDPVRARVLAQALDDARANADLARLLQERLVRLAQAWKVRTAVRRARRQTLVAATVIAVGVILFLTATHEPETTRAGSPPSGAATR